AAVCACQRFWSWNDSMKLIANLAAFDLEAIEELGIAGLLLMENAGRAVASAVCQWVRQNEPMNRELNVVVLCGPGNNGGDGFACARHLTMLAGQGAFAPYHIHSRVLSVNDLDDYTGDAATNAALLAHYPVRVLASPAIELLEKCVAEADVIVDGLFGSGLNRAIDEELADWVAAVNRAVARSNVPVVAIDMPSGIDARTGQVHGCAVNATVTVTLQAGKPGLYLYPGRACAGMVQTVDIGLPPKLFNPSDLARHAPGEPLVQLVTSAMVAQTLPTRSADSHKYAYGNAMVIGGCPTMPGAPLMSARAAFVAGCGYVRLAAPVSAMAQMQLPAEVVTLPLGDEVHDAAQAVGHGTVVPADIERIRPIMGQADVIVLGPGLGRSEPVQQFVESMTALLLQEYKGLVVLDADGLNALSQLQTPFPLNHRFVLTPHVGEAARLLKTTSSAVKADMIKAASALAQLYRCTVVLKSSSTVIAGQRLSETGQPQIEVWINPTGDSGMATAGSGDVLTGLIAGLLAQMANGESMLSPADMTGAVAAITYLHGLAGQHASAELTPYAVTATELLRFFPHALKQTLPMPTAPVPFNAAVDPMPGGGSVPVCPPVQRLSC
ncbi:MAG: NAD(P)H-hydrate dehydratase, partial [Cyanobacteria bacterium HKST-UBA03]|nr:NAD(P)H-hydrate dehydratase [Cyanobacteria bacterium HKST-UBA03]